MRNRDSYPDDYEEVFNLILSLVEQVRSDFNESKQISAEEMNDYFSRLSRGSLGEYEFTRRMAYDSIPVARIAALPILWQKYAQPVTPDFIVRIDGKSICVEVKDCHWRKYINTLEIKKSSLDNCRKFRDFMGLDRACVGIKRFEKWYLIDIEDYLKHATIVNNYSCMNYKVPIKDILNKNLLNEELVVFDTGNRYKASQFDAYPPKNSKPEGVIYKWIRIEPNSSHIKLYYGYDKTKNRVFEATQKEIIQIIYKTIEKNLRDLLSKGYEFNDVKYVEDMLPTKFSITDKLRDKYKKNEVDSHFNTLKDVICCGNNEEVRYYFSRIYSVLFCKYEKILISKGLNIHVMKDLIKNMNVFKDTFK